MYSKRPKCFFSSRVVSALPGVHAGTACFATQELVLTTSQSSTSPVKRRLRYSPGSKLFLGVLRAPCCTPALRGGISDSPLAELLRKVQVLGLRVPKLFQFSSAKRLKVAGGGAAVPSGGSKSGSKCSCCCWRTSSSSPDSEESASSSEYIYICRSMYIYRQSAAVCG